MRKRKYERDVKQLEYKVGDDMYSRLKKTKQKTHPTTPNLFFSSEKNEKVA